MPEINVTLCCGEFIFTVNGKKLETRDIADEINLISRDMLGEHLGDVRKYLTEAKSYLEQSVNWNGAAYVANAVSSLVFAHKHLLLAKEKKVMKRYLLVFNVSEEAIADKLLICDRCTRLAVIIHELYCILHDFNEAASWYKKTLDDMNNHLQEFRNKYGYYLRADNYLTREEYNKLVALSPDFANERIEERTTYKGYIQDYGEVYDTERIAYLTITPAGIEYCRQQEALIKDFAHHKLDKGMAILPLFEEDLEERRSMLLAEYANNSH